MTNLEKYTETFVKSLEISPEQTKGLEYQSIDAWDSVGHMVLMAAIEEAFDIMLETDDIIDFNSFEKGMEILSEKYDVKFA